MRPPFAPVHAAALVRLADLALRASCRFSVEDPDALVGSGASMFVCRHGQLWASLWAVRGTGTRVLVSHSPDGELLAHLLAGWGFRVTRGSTSAAGLSGARGALRALRRAEPVGMAIDGPRGPRGEVQEGSLRLARRAGVPLVPLRVSGGGRWVVRRSWDHFEIPRPFGALRVHVGPAVIVGPGDEGLERARTELERALDVVSPASAEPPRENAGGARP